MPATQDPADASAHRVLPPAFGCSWTDSGHHAAWVHVTGELDIATTPELERALREAQGRARLVVLDMRELAFMDTCGALAIVNASLRAREAGQRLLVLRGPPNVDRLFALTGSSDHVEIGDLRACLPPVRALLELAKGELLL